MPNKKEPFDLEAVYDDEIAPLMAKIIEICREHKLPVFATFMYGSDADERHDYCTTNILFEEGRPISDGMKDLLRNVYQPCCPPMRMRVTKSDGAIEDTVIIP